MSKIVNTSGFHPKGYAVLVLPYEPEMKKAEEKSRIVLPEQVKERSRMVETRALVVEVGACAWSEEPEPRAKVGDTVLITRYAGELVSPDIAKDGKGYRLVNDRDIYCVIEVDNNG